MQLWIFASIKIKTVLFYGKKVFFRENVSIRVNEPILIECLTPESRLDEVIEKINGIITKGTICTIPVQDTSINRLKLDTDFSFLYNVRKMCR